MKLYADRYFIESDAERGDGILRPPHALQALFSFESEEFEMGPDGTLVPIEFNVYQHKGTEVKEYTISGNFSKYTSSIYPGEDFYVLIRKKNADIFVYFPLEGVFRMDESLYKEIRIFGVRAPVDFGIRDIGLQLGGTYCDIHFSTLEGEWSRVVAYNYVVDFPWTITTSFTLSMLMGPNTGYLNQVPGNFHSLMIDTLYPGNNYTLLALIVDFKGYYQIFAQQFTTKQRSLKLNVLQLTTEFVGDGDGVGDSSFFWNELAICEHHTIQNQAFFPIIWNRSHVAGATITLSYIFQFPFQKYTKDTHAYIKTSGREGNGLDSPGIADSDNVDGFLMPSTILNPVKNGVLTPYFRRGKMEDYAVTCSVKAQSVAGKGSLFVYNLSLIVTCYYR